MGEGRTQAAGDEDSIYQIIQFLAKIEQQENEH